MASFRSVYSITSSSGTYEIKTNWKQNRSKMKKEKPVSYPHPYNIKQKRNFPISTISVSGHMENTSPFCCAVSGISSFSWRWELNWTHRWLGKLSYWTHWVTITLYPIFFYKTWIFFHFSHSSAEQYFGRHVRILGKTILYIAHPLSDFKSFLQHDARNETLTTSGYHYPQGSNSLIFSKLGVFGPKFNSYQHYNL